MMFPVSTRRRRRRRFWLLAAAPLGLMLAVGLFLGLTCRPGWYQPPPVDYDRLAADQRDFVTLLDQIGVALNGGRAIELHLDQEQLNRWLAARHDLSHEVIDLSLTGIADPFIELHDNGSVRLGARLEGGGWGAVLGLRLTPGVAGDQVHVRWEGLSLGAVAIPRAALSGLARRALGSRPELAALVESGRLETLNDFVWPNGRRRYQFGELEVTQGRLRMVLKPG